MFGRLCACKTGILLHYIILIREELETNHPYLSLTHPSLYIHIHTVVTKSIEICWQHKLTITRKFCRELCRNNGMYAIFHYAKYILYQSMQNAMR